MNSKINSILNKDREKYLAVLGFISNYPIEEAFIEGDSVLILGKSDQLWAHILSSSESELAILLEKYHIETKYYYSVEDWMIPLILKHGEEDWRMTTNRFTLNAQIDTDSPTCNIIQIDKSFASHMFNNSDYKDYLSIEYIEDRLNKDISAGIIIDDVLIAWGFTHDDGALGFLNVLPKYRKKGYGLEIMLGLIQMRKMDKKPIFGNIVPGNIASTNLVTKLGFKLDCKASWIKLK